MVGERQRMKVMAVGSIPKRRISVSVHAVNDFLTHLAGVLINAAVALAAR
jgi:hypothetical protein